MAELIPDEKCLVLNFETFFISKNTPGYCLGPLMPLTADGAVFFPCLDRRYTVMLGKVAFP